MTSCKLKIGNLDPITPHFDTHMHGPGSKPTTHTHSAAHKHPFRCDYKGKEYKSTLDCGEKHMHGADAPPHRHLTEDVNHAKGFQCMYQGKGKIYSSDKDCFQHFHRHIHGLKLTKYDPHGLNIDHRHTHDHKHTGDHAHENPGYKCYGFPSDKPCDIIHTDAHMHGEGTHHIHKHDHKNEHAHLKKDLKFNCLSDKSDPPHALYPSNIPCDRTHSHLMVYKGSTRNTSNVSPPLMKEHSHDKEYRGPRHDKCYYKGTSYPCNKY